MKNKISTYRIPLLFSALCMALMLLIVFQVNWLLTSRAMIEEQFDQKVNLALGSAMSHHNDAYSSRLDLELANAACSPDAGCCLFASDTISISAQEQHALGITLSNAMASFGIEEEYQVALLNDPLVKSDNSKSYSCSINPLKNDKKNDVRLSVSFPCKQQYVFDKLKFMIISAVLISLLLASISFIILRALVQQKRLTENNIDFFNNTAHELKTPLTNISLALSLFNRKNEHSKDQKYLDIIKRESSKLSHQVDRVLYLSKMENGEYTLDEVAVNLKEVIQEAVQYMDMIREEKNGTIELDLPQEDCIVKGDRFHLSNICINLLDNALKYCDSDPVVKISLRQQDGALQLLFKDNGIGISKYDQEHIFKKFQRVNTGDIQNTKGFGIGLAYVRAVLELHKGFIKVDSEVDNGSQFEISIPTV